MNARSAGPGLPESASPAQMAAGRIQRAHALLPARRYDLAVKELRGALAVDAGHAEAHGLLGYCLALIANVDHRIREEAEREAMEAVRLAPDRAFLHRLRGATLLTLDRPHEARDALQEALRLGPDDAHTHSLVAWAERRQGDAGKALAAADAGLAIDPESTSCANERMLALHDLGCRTEAEAAARELLRRTPESALAHAVLGHLLVEGEHRAALEHFRTALRISPDDKWARLGLVRALKMQYRTYRLFRRLDMATPLFNVVLWLHPRDRHALPPGVIKNSMFALIVVITLVVTGIVHSGAFILVLLALILMGWLVPPTSWILMSSGGRPSRHVPDALRELRYRPLWLVALLGVLILGLSASFWLLHTS